MNNETIYIINAKETCQDSLQDLANDNEPRFIRFIDHDQYAVVIAPPYAGEGYSSRTNLKSASRLSNQLTAAGVPNKIISITGVVQSVEVTDSEQWTPGEVESFCNSLDSTPDYEEVIEHLVNDEEDFTVANVRFIKSSFIDEIMKQEMASDEYALGCCSPWVFSDATGIDIDVFEALQKAGAYAAIGKLILSNPEWITNLQHIVCQYDGYGNHFNGYNGESIELYDTDNVHQYHVFDNH